MRLSPRTTRHAIDGGAPAAGRYLAAGSKLVPIMGTVTRLGRSLSADVEIDDPSVSRRHALIVRQDGQTVPARRRQPQRHLAQRPARRPRRPARRRHRSRSGSPSCATWRSSRRRRSPSSSSPREVLLVDRALGLGPARERQRGVLAGRSASRYARSSRRIASARAPSIGPPWPGTTWSACSTSGSSRFSVARYADSEPPSREHRDLDRREVVAGDEHARPRHPDRHPVRGVPVGRVQLERLRRRCR